MLRLTSALLLALASCHALPGGTEPRGVRLGLTKAIDEVTVRWQTQVPTPRTVARVAPVSDGAGLPLIFEGAQRSFDASSTRTIVLHTVTITGLSPGALYTYELLNSTTWTAPRTFRSRRSPGDTAPLQLLAFCDAGVVDGQRRAALDAAALDVAEITFDALLHCGDFAYDLNSEDGKRGEQFLNDIEPMVSSLPYLTAPGNHEIHANMSYYKALFGEDLFWSIDIGPIHLVSYNTEMYFWPEWYGAEHAARQHAWLDADLAAADANREAVPWIIVTGHRPMYCTWPDATTGACDGEHEASRKGILSVCSPLDGHSCMRRWGATANLSVEQLLRKHGVDVAIFGHIHIYSRSWPVHDEVVYAYGDGAYVDPPATVHMVTGAGGNGEMKLGEKPPPQGKGGRYIAFQSGYAPADGQSADYSYSRVTVHNATTLEWVQMSGTLGGVVDHFVLTRTRGVPSFGEQWAADDKLLTSQPLTGSIAVD